MASPKFRFGGGHLVKMYSSKTLKNVGNFLQICTNIKKLFKIFQKENLIESKKI